MPSYTEPETVRVGIERDGERVTMALRSPHASATLTGRVSHLASIATVLLSACGEDARESFELWIRGEMAAQGT